MSLALKAIVWLASVITVTVVVFPWLVTCKGSKLMEGLEESFPYLARRSFWIVLFTLSSMLVFRRIQATWLPGVLLSFPILTWTSLKPSSLSTFLIVGISLLVTFSAGRNSS